MLGPSGFFQELDGIDCPDSSFELEIFHVSEFGFNILYKGSRNGRFFIYKALKPEFQGNPVYENLLRKDFEIGFSLSHIGICQYYDYVFLPNAGNCIVMEWIDGCNLQDLINKEKLDKKLVSKIISELCDALEYIHRKQIVHRDLKPENIIVTYNGRNAKIIDFGLSDADSYNVYKMPAGTKVYASPELLAGEPIDNRSDIWSLGLIIKEMSPYYQRVASGCLKRDRTKRYHSALQVRNAVHGYGNVMASMTAAIFILFVSVVGVAMGFGAFDNDTEIRGNNGQVVMEFPFVSDDTIPDSTVAPSKESYKSLQSIEHNEPIVQEETFEQEHQVIGSVDFDKMLDAAALEIF